MTYPRACALSEQVWSPRERTGTSEAFLSRLTHHLNRLDAATGIKYRALD